MSVIRSQRIHSQPIDSQKGIGLIEVLMAALVFALGILGMATMQINAKRVSYDALQRSIATSLTRDIVERMRSNPSPAALAIFDAVNNLGGGSISTAPAACSQAVQCSVTALAARDIYEWEQALDGAAETLGGTSVGGLVSPRACISHNAGVVTVTIAWKGSNNSQTDDLSANTCGRGLGLYGTNEVDRQLITVTTYIEQV